MVKSNSFGHTNKKKLCSLPMSTVIYIYKLFSEFIIQQIVEIIIESYPQYHTLGILIKNVIKFFS